MHTDSTRTSTMNPRTADAIRAELGAIGTHRSGLQRRQRRNRVMMATVIGGGLALATTAAAVVTSLPGTTTTAPLGQIVASTQTGTGTIDVGRAPAHAGAVILNLTCLSNRGTLSVRTISSTQSAGSSATIDCSTRSTSVHIEDGLLPSGGSDRITVTADAGTRWRGTAQYASSSVSAWAVNGHDQTYGVPNINGVPDLSAARATNGRQGYILTAQLLDGTTTIKVYESDGTTVIGQFDLEPAQTTKP